MTKIQDKNLNILRMRRAFKVKQKAIFIIFKELLVAKTFVRPEAVPLRIFSLWSISQMITKTVPINTRIVISYALN